MSLYYGLPNRYICQVIAEMRDSVKTLSECCTPELVPRMNFLLSLIEEMQCLAQRMEAALEDNKDYEAYRQERSQLKREIKALEARKKELENLDGGT